MSVSVGDDFIDLFTDALASCGYKYESRRNENYAL
jgi:hypothetical protein